MNDHPQKILVTGAAGFIGFHVAQRLCGDGHSVHGLDNLNDYYDPTLKEDRLLILRALPNFTFTRADLADRDGMNALFASFNPTIVIHLAAQAGVRYSLTHPHDYIDANITGFLNVLEGCRHNAVQHLVYASSSSVYGGNIKVPFAEEDSVDHPVSLYAATKKANELMAHSYAHLYNIPCTGLRFFTVYGPWGRPDMAAFKFVKAAFDGTPIDVYNFGDMKRDFTYIDDIVVGVVGVMNVPPVRGANGAAAAQIFNIGHNHPENLMDLIAIIERETGLILNKNMLPMQAGDVPSTYASIDRLQALTGFTPHTKLEQGIAHFVRWYRDYYKIGNGPA